MHKSQTETSPDFAQNAAHFQPANRRFRPMLLGMTLCSLFACGQGADRADPASPPDETDAQATAQTSAALLRSRPPILPPTQKLSELSTITPSLCSSVVMDGNTAVFNDTYRFRAVIMTYSGGRWQTQATVTPTLPGYTPGFPYCFSMALHGDTLVLGHHIMYTPSGSYWAPQGSVFVFRRSGTTWTQQQALIGFGTEGLGIRVAVSDDLLVAVTASGDYLRTYRFSGGMWTLLPAGGVALRARPSEMAFSGKRLAIADSNDTARDYETDGTRWALVEDLAGPRGYWSVSTQLQADQLAVMWKGPGRPTPPHTFVQMYQAVVGRFVSGQRIEHPEYPDQDHLGYRLTMDRDWLVTHDSEKGLSFVYRQSAGSWTDSWTIVSGRAHMAVRGSQVLLGPLRYTSTAVPGEAFTLR